MLDGSDIISWNVRFHTKHRSSKSRFMWRDMRYIYGSGSVSFIRIWPIASISINYDTIVNILGRSYRDLHALFKQPSRFPSFLFSWSTHQHWTYGDFKDKKQFIDISKHLRDKTKISATTGLSIVDTLWISLSWIFIAKFHIITFSPKHFHSLVRKIVARFSS